MASESATIVATQSVMVDLPQLEHLISELVNSIPTDTTKEDREQIEDNIEVIRSEAGSSTPKRGFLRSAINGIRAIKSTAEFGAAAVALYQFIAPLL